MHLPYDLNFYDETSKMYLKLRNQGKTIRSTIDLIIAMTAVWEDIALLHNDKDFDELARVLEDLQIM